MTIPNDGDPAYTDTEYQSRPNQADWDILEAGVSGLNGVVSGLVVSEAGPPDMSVDVTSGNAAIEGVLVPVTGGNVAIAAADGTDPRMDLIVAVDDGTVDVLPGTASAAPFMVTPPAGMIGLAQVFVPANALAIVDGDIVRKLVPVRDPTQITAGWTTIEATSDLDKTNDATMAADPVLQFAMVANEKYRIRLHVTFKQQAFPVFSGGGMKGGFGGPASPTFLHGHGLFSANNAPAQGIIPVTATQYAMTSYNTVGIQMLGFSGVNYTGAMLWEIVVQNGANSGTFAFWWCQMTSNANTMRRLAGSYLEYAEIA